MKHHKKYFMSGRLLVENCFLQKLAQKVNQAMLQLVMNDIEWRRRSDRLKIIICFITDLTAKYWRNRRINKLVYQIAVHIKISIGSKINHHSMFRFTRLTKRSHVGCGWRFGLIWPKCLMSKGLSSTDCRVIKRSCVFNQFNPNALFRLQHNTGIRSNFFSFLQRLNGEVSQHCG